MKNFRQFIQTPGSVTISTSSIVVTHISLTGDLSTSPSICNVYERDGTTLICRLVCRAFFTPPEDAFEIKYQYVECSTPFLAPRGVIIQSPNGVANLRIHIIWQDVGA